MTSKGNPNENQDIVFYEDEQTKLDFSLVNAQGYLWYNSGKLLKDSDYNFLYYDGVEDFFALVDFALDEPIAIGIDRDIKNRVSSRGSSEDVKFMTCRGVFRARLLEMYKDFLYGLRMMNNCVVVGPPGSGKSSFVNSEIKKIVCGLDSKESQTERFVMSNASMHEDLWGSYKPTKKNGVVSYEFVPGPFARLLLKAFLEKKHNCLMIIEELNRGDSLEVLGKLLYIIERNIETGESRYRIQTPGYVNEYFTANGVNDVSDGLYLPSNFFLVCTINKSDSGVQEIEKSVQRLFSFIQIDAEGNIYGVPSSYKDVFEFTLENVKMVNNDCFLDEEQIHKTIGKINENNNINIQTHFLDGLMVQYDDKMGMFGCHILINLAEYLFSINWSNSQEKEFNMSGSIKKYYAAKEHTQETLEELLMKG